MGASLLEVMTSPNQPIVTSATKASTSVSALSANRDALVSSPDVSGSKNRSHITTNSLLDCVTSQSWQRPAHMAVDHIQIPLQDGLQILILATSSVMATAWHKPDLSLMVVLGNVTCQQRSWLVWRATCILAEAWNQRLFITQLVSFAFIRSHLIYAFHLSLTNRSTLHAQLN